MKRKLTWIVPLILIGTILVSCKKDDDGTTAEEEAVEVVNLQHRSEKRGVSYGFQLLDDVALLAPGTSWFYNWGNDISYNLEVAVSAEDMKFFPMTWNGNFNKDKIRAYKQKHPECEYILAYNEPNLTDQANMTPQEAAAIFPEVKELADELDMKIISPAMNYGTLSNYHDPIKWLDEFFELIPLSSFDGIAIHCYMAAPSAFKSYVQMFKKYGKPIWMTEFCAWENNIKNVGQQMKYMVDVLNYMEADPDVFRYAWFIPRTGGNVDSYPYMQLLTKSQPYALTDLGKVYIHMSTFDKTTYYGKDMAIPAAHYVALNSTASASQDGWQSSVYVRPTTDVSGVLEVYQFTSNQWIDYQIDVPVDGNYTFDLRRASYRDVSLEISVNGEVAKTWNLDKTGDDDVWKTDETTLSLEKGKHTLRIKVLKGNTCLNWMRFR